MLKKHWIVSLLLLTLVAAPMFSSSQAQANEVVVSSKEFTESIILGQITLLALEENGIPVSDRTNLTGSIVVREAQEIGEIDIYWEYTGTALITHLGYDQAITDPDECYEVVKTTDAEQNDLIWLDYTPFDNTYTLMMQEEHANDLGITSISDLAEAINSGQSAPVSAGWVFATNHEYAIRDDGYIGLNERYDFEFDNVITMDLGITYGAVRDEQVAVALGFATDGRIAAFGLVNLVDDLQFHPVYNASPVVRAEVLEQYPQIADILNPIAKTIDSETMSSLNAMVDIEGYEPDEVAEMWLQEQGYIQ